MNTVRVWATVSLGACPEAGFEEELVELLAMDEEDAFVD